MAIKLKLELNGTKIMRVVTVPRGLNLEDLVAILTEIDREQGGLGRIADTK